MQDPLDAYQQWLGIPPEEQPPDHYRLLGLARLESDAQLVTAAAQRQIARIKRQATRDQLAVAQKLVKQIARARSLLLDPQLRAQYNARLQRAAASPGAGQRTGAPRSAGPEIHPQEADLPPLPAIDTRRSRGGPGASGPPDQAGPGQQPATAAGRKKFLDPRHFPWPLRVTMGLLAAAILLALVLPQLWPDRSQRLLFSPSSSPREPRTPAVAPLADQPPVEPQPREATAKEGGFEEPPSRLGPVPPSDAGDTPAAADGPAPTRSLVPPTTGPDPLRKELSLDHLPDNVFRDDESSESDQPAGPAPADDGETPSSTRSREKAAGGTASGGEVERSEGAAAPAQMTFEEEQARHGQSEQPRDRTGSPSER